MDDNDNHCFVVDALSVEILHVQGKADNPLELDSVGYKISGKNDTGVVVADYFGGLCCKIGPDFMRDAEFLAWEARISPGDTARGSLREWVLNDAQAQLEQHVNAYQDLEEAVTGGDEHAVGRALGYILYHELGDAEKLGTQLKLAISSPKDLPTVEKIVEMFLTDINNYANAGDKEKILDIAIPYATQHRPALIPILTETHEQAVSRRQLQSSAEAKTVTPRLAEAVGDKKEAGCGLDDL